MIMTDELTALAIADASADDVKRKAIEQGMLTLRQDGWRKVAMGETTISEILRIVS